MNTSTKRLGRALFAATLSLAVAGCGTDNSDDGARVTTAGKPAFRVLLLPFKYTPDIRWAEKSLDRDVNNMKSYFRSSAERLMLFYLHDFPEIRADLQTCAAGYGDQDGACMGVMTKLRSSSAGYGKYYCFNQACNTAHAKALEQSIDAIEIAEKMHHPERYNFNPDFGEPAEPYDPVKEGMYDLVVQSDDGSVEVELHELNSLDVVSEHMSLSYGCPAALAGKTAEELGFDDVPHGCQSKYAKLIENLVSPNPKWYPQSKIKYGGPYEVRALRPLLESLVAKVKAAGEAAKFDRVVFYGHGMPLAEGGAGWGHVEDRFIRRWSPKPGYNFPMFNLDRYKDAAGSPDLAKVRAHVFDDDPTAETPAEKELREFRINQRYFEELGAMIHRITRDSAKVYIGACNAATGEKACLSDADCAGWWKGESCDVSSSTKKGTCRTGPGTAEPVDFQVTGGDISNPNFGFTNVIETWACTTGRDTYGLGNKTAGHDVTGRMIYLEHGLQLYFSDDVGAQDDKGASPVGPTVEAGGAKVAQAYGALIAKARQAHDQSYYFKENLEPWPYHQLRCGGKGPLVTAGAPPAVEQ